MGRDRARRDRGRPALVRPRINGRKSRTYYVAWFDGSRSRRVSTGTSDEADARRFLIEFAAGLEARRPDDPTIEDMCAAYVEDRRGRVQYLATIEQRLKPIRARLGALRAAALKPGVIQRYHRDRFADGVQTATIDGEIRALRQALKLAQRQDWIDRLPEIATPGPGQPRQRYLSPPEVERLIAATDHPNTAPHIKTFVLLALYTAQRGGAIRELRWEHVDQGRGILWFPAGKSRLKNRVSVTMSPTLAAYLAREAETPDSAYVVSYNGGPVRSVRKGFDALVRRAGLADVHIHDLRRTAASLMLMRGASFAVVAAILGDDERIVRKHYAMFDPTYLRQGLDLLDPGPRQPALPKPDESA
jgi:integrase